MSVINVAIDGPAGAGKSSIAKRAAAKLGFIYVDTGALYRTVGLHILRCGIDTKDGEKIEKELPDLKVSMRFVDGEQRVFLFDEDVSTAIRTPEASMAASNVSAIPAVRAFLFSLQQDIAKNNNCLMDGRDIGTVVLPDAKVKIFLTASPEERANRRCLELQEKNMPTPYEEVLADIIERDYNDSHRAIAPLKQADDAVLLDTSELSFDESFEAVIRIIEEKTK